jgi:hypothetical protein
MEVAHGEGEFHVVLHCLREAGVALVLQHDFARVEVLQAEDLVSADGQAEEVLHVLLSGAVAAQDLLLLLVDDNGAAGYEVARSDLQLGVVRCLEELAALLVEEVAVHLELLGGVVDAGVRDLHVDDLEVVVADALAQVLLQPGLVFQAEVQRAEAVFDVLLEVVVLVAAAQRLLQLQLELLVVLGHELQRSGVSLRQLLLLGHCQVVAEVELAAGRLHQPLARQRRGLQHLEGGALGGDVACGEHGEQAAGLQRQG